MISGGEFFFFNEKECLIKEKHENILLSIIFLGSLLLFI